MTPTPAPTLAPQRARFTFPACNVGVVLRAVVALETALALAALFTSSSTMDWLYRAAWWTGLSLPSLLAWLVLACGVSRQRLAALSPAWHVTLLAVAAVVCTLAMSGVMQWAGVWPDPPWGALAATAALFAVVFVNAWRWREAALHPSNPAAQLAVLQARIRPHFLFNTLNSAAALVRSEPRQAESMLEALADVFRHALASDAATATLREEVDLARHYLSIEEIRFGPRLRVRWDLDEASLDAVLPHMLLQPLLENAVRHGVEPSARGAELRIQTQRRGDSVVIKIDNSLPAGADAGEPGHGMALTNCRQRLALMYDVEAQLDARPVGEFFRVRIQVPARGVNA